MSIVNRPAHLLLNKYQASAVALLAAILAAVALAGEVRRERSVGFTSQEKAAAVLNLNTATVAELQLVPTIGPVLAQKVVELRSACGGFDSVDDLQAVNGIGRIKIERMRPYVTAGRPGVL